MTNASNRILPQISLLLAVLAAASTAIGVASGLGTYLHRSPIRQQFVPGTSAWGQQLAVAAVAGLLFAFARWRHNRRFGRRSGRLLLLAPLGKSAAARLARTMAAAARGHGLPRALLALAPAAMIGYSCWRVGEQVIAGLDPNFTVNAWGGPSYLGAMACHYLDAALLIAASAWLLDKILLPAAADRIGPKARAVAVPVTSRPSPNPNPNPKD